MVNVSKIKDQRFVDRWRKSGAFGKGILESTEISNLQVPNRFTTEDFRRTSLLVSADSFYYQDRPDILQKLEGRKVLYVASAGKVAKTYDLAYVEHSLIQLGYKPFKVNDGLGAVTELLYDKPTVVTYWDNQGRVCKTDFIGNRGGVDTNGMTNLYSFDKEGRLVSFNQYKHPKVGKTKLYRGSRYEYLVGRPDNEYTEHFTDTEGKITVKTFEDRNKNGKRNPPTS